MIRLWGVWGEVGPDDTVVLVAATSIQEVAERIAETAHAQGGYNENSVRTAPLDIVETIEEARQHGWLDDPEPDDPDDDVEPDEEAEAEQYSFGVCEGCGAQTMRQDADGYKCMDCQERLPHQGG